MQNDNNYSSAWRHIIKLWPGITIIILFFLNPNVTRGPPYMSAHVYTPQISLLCDNKGSTYLILFHFNSIQSLDLFLCGVCMFALCLRGFIQTCRFHQLKALNNLLSSCVMRLCHVTHPLIAGMGPSCTATLTSGWGLIDGWMENDFGGLPAKASFDCDCCIKMC